MKMNWKQINERLGAGRRGWVTEAKGDKHEFTDQDVKSSLKKPVVKKVTKEIDKGRLMGPGAPPQKKDLTTYVRLTSKMGPYKWKSGDKEDWQEEDVLTSKVEVSYDGKKWTPREIRKTDPTKQFNQQVSDIVKWVNSRFRPELTETVDEARRMYFDGNSIH